MNMSRWICTFTIWTVNIVGPAYIFFLGSDKLDQAMKASITGLIKSLFFVGAAVSFLTFVYSIFATGGGFARIMFYLLGLAVWLVELFLISKKEGSDKAGPLL
jgi:hypothetical protein